MQRGKYFFNGISHWAWKNWSLDENLDQKLIHSTQLDLKHQLNILLQAFPKKISK